MSMSNVFPAEGGCDCKGIRYRLESAPLFVHCCHCRWCQRESGASFALNALIEADQVTLLAGEPELVDTPSESGKGQIFARCPTCRIAVWSSYSGMGPLIRFVRVGTLDDPDLMPPDIHIFTASRQPWVVLPPGVPAVPEYYDRREHWPEESLARHRILLPLIKAQRVASRSGE
ncbi:GFA family protein [Marilutibacter spongiae]|nr:GFA family protein [Lysobacter spongiae]